jgi:hypothetical protein
VLAVRSGFGRVYPDADPLAWLETGEFALIFIDPWSSPPYINPTLF